MSIIKLGITADIHLCGKWLNETVTALKYSFNEMRQMGVNYHLCAGDFFHYINIADRSKSVGEIVGTANDMLVDLANAGIPTITIAGQHDKRGGDKSALRTLKVNYLVEKPMSLKLTPGIALLAMPWMFKSERLTAKEMAKPNSDRIFKDKILDEMRILSKSYDNEFKILLGHCILVGSEARGGHLFGDDKFAFTMDELQSIGADYIALGDNHRGTEPFIGSIMQRDFGDEGNRTGWKYLEIDTEKQKIVKEEYINIPGKRYFTLTNSEYQQNKDNGKITTEDHYRIKDTEKPDIKLPPNVIFVKELDKTPQTEDREEISGESLFEQFQQFNAIKNLLPEKTLPEAEKAIEAAKEEAAFEEEKSGGSLEKIDRIHLENIGPHKTLDFELQPGIFGISGANGVGKTFLIEAIFAAFYSNFLTYKGSIYDQVKQDSDGDALIEVDFWSGGKKYKAQRKIKGGKNQSQEAFLFTFDGNEYHSITSGREVDFQEAIQALVGDPKQLQASIFVSQELVGDITGGKRKDRMEFIHNLLNIEKYGLFAEVFKDKKNELKTKIDVNNDNKDRITASLETDRNYANELQSAEVKEKETLDTLEKIKKGITKNQKMKEKASVELARLQEKKSAIEGGIKQYNEKVKQCNIYEAKILEATGQKAKADSLRYDPEEEDRLRAKITKIKGEKQKMGRLRVAEAELQSLRMAVNGKKKLLEGSIEKLQMQTDHLEKRSTMISNAGCADNPISNCCFLQDAFQAKEALADSEEELINFQDRLDNKKYVSKEDRMGLHKLKKMLKENKVNEELLNKESEYRTGLKAFQTIKEEAKKAELYQSKIDEYREILTRLKDEAKKMNTEDSSKIDNEILMTEKRKTALRDTIFEAEEKQRRIDEKLRVIQYDIAMAKQAITQQENNKKLLADMDKNIEAHTHNLIIYAALHKAFDRRGIPQYLISNSIPRIQDIVNEILVIIDNPFLIRFVTQTQTKGGKTKEDFEIMIESACGIRPIGRYSGGEKQLIRLIIRIALTLFKARSHGGNYGFIVLDEPFVNLRADSATKVLKIISTLSGTLTQGIITSHNDGLLAQLPQCFDMERGEMETILR